MSYLIPIVVSSVAFFVLIILGIVIALLVKKKINSVSDFVKQGTNPKNIPQ